MNDNQHKEFRLKSGSIILDYIKKFSATEKVVFGIFVIAALVTAIIMTGQINSSFMVSIPAHGGILHEGEIGLPHTVNPVLAVTDVDRDLSSLIYSGLTAYKNSTIVPDLASDWNVSADGLTYTFNLRPGLVFQDGTPLTANDVVYTIEKIQDPTLKSPHAGDWTNVTATSSYPYQVTFTLKQPYRGFLANTNIGIIPKHIWGVVSDDQFIFSEYNIKPVGSGPYNITGLTRDQGGIPTEYKLSTWSGYYGQEPLLAQISFTFFPDQDNALSALESNSIDSLSSIPPDAASTLSTNVGEPYKTMSTPLPRVFGVFFDQGQNAVLADASVRQALNMSVDRDSIIKTVLLGFGSPIVGPLPTSVAANSNATSSSFNIASAQTILTKANWKMGPNGIFTKKIGKTATTTLAFTLYTADTPDLKKAADILKSNWTTLGASVSIKIYEPADLYQNIIRPRKYDALLFGETIGRDRDLYAFWHSSQRNAPGLNVALYTNSKVDKLLESIRGNSASSTDLSYATLENLIESDLPAVFLYVPDFIYAVPKTLHGIDLGSITTPTDRFNSIGDWYIDTENVWKIFAKNNQ